MQAVTFLVAKRPCQVWLPITHISYQFNLRCYHVLHACATALSISQRAQPVSRPKGGDVLSWQRSGTEDEEAPIAHEDRLTAARPT